MARRQSSNQVKRFFQNFLVATTGRWTISLPSVAVFLPFSFLYSLERESMLNVGTFRTQLMIVTAGELAGLLYIFLIQATLLSSRKERRQSFMLCMFVWFSSGIVSGLVSEFYGRYTVGTDSHLLTRIANSSFTSGLGLGILAYCFGSVNKLKTEKDVFHSLQLLLSEDSSQLHQSRQKATELAISNLNESLLPKVLQLQNLTSDLKRNGTSESLAVALHVLEEQAKDLHLELNLTLSEIKGSHALPDSKSADTSAPMKLMAGPFPRNLSVATSFMVLALGATLAQSTRNGLMGAFVGILSSVIIVAVLYTLRTFGKSLNSVGTGWFNAVSYILVFGVQYLTTSTVQNYLTSLPYPYQPWYSALKTFCGVYLASLISTLVIEQNRSVDIMKIESLKQRERVEDLSISNDQIQQLTASTLVGAIQGQISGVIMALNVLTNTHGFQDSKRDLSKFIAKTSDLLGDAISEIQQAGKKAHSR